MTLPDPSLDMLVYVFPIYFGTSIMSLFQALLVSVVDEKKKKLKDGLQMIGCSVSI